MIPNFNGMDMSQLGQINNQILQSQSKFFSNLFSAKNPIYRYHGGEHQLLPGGLQTLYCKRGFNHPGTPSKRKLKKKKF